MSFEKLVLIGIAWAASRPNAAAAAVSISYGRRLGSDAVLHIYTTPGIGLPLS